MPDVQHIRRFLEREESQSDGLIYSDPSLVKHRERMIRAIGRSLGVIDAAAVCTRWIQGAVFTALVSAVIAFWFIPDIYMFAGGMAAMGGLTMIWIRIRRYWPWRLITTKSDSLL